MVKLSRRALCALVVLAAPLLMAPKRSIELEPADKAKIHKIALLSIGGQDLFFLSTPEVRTANAVGGAIGGVLGYLVASALTPEEAVELSGDMMEQASTIGPPMNEAIEQALQAGGYEIEVIEVKRKHGDLIEDYSRIRTGADAILDIEVHLPHFDDIFVESEGFAPNIRVDVQIVKKESRFPILFRQAYAYQDVDPDASRIIWIPVDAGCRFPTFEAAYADKERLSECMRAVGPKIARIVADVLK